MFSVTCRRTENVHLVLKKKFSKILSLEQERYLFNSASDCNRKLFPTKIITILI